MNIFFLTIPKTVAGYQNVLEKILSVINHVYKRDTWDGRLVCRSLATSHVSLSIYNKITQLIPINIH